MPDQSTMAETTLDAPAPSAASRALPVTAIVPTLGRSALLPRCLEQLRREGGSELQVIVVSQNSEQSPALTEADKVLSTNENLGFSAACNWAIEHTDGELVALVNDDAIVQAGWLETLTRALADRPQVAAAQGINLDFADHDRIDGCGIAWNWWWRPVQIGQGLEANVAGTTAHSVFGVSATAAVYRRRALATVAFANGDVFDPRLKSFYEDVDLAIRLRRKGFDSLMVPTARAWHQGGATSKTLSRASNRWRYSHRYLVLARLSGRRFLLRAPLLIFRDVLDIGLMLLKARAGSVGDVARGWSHALRLLGPFSHRQAPLASGSSFPTRIRRAASWPSIWTDRP